MSEWAPKRFWKETTVTEAPQGFTVTLDGRGIKTPAKTPIHVPTRTLAEALAAEWEAQEAKVNPATMPFTRTTNSALDKVATQRAEVADMLAAYGDADLTCYRAGTPEELVARQAAAWDPLLDWLDKTFGARLHPRTGVMHEPQDARALDILLGQVHALSPFELAAFHDLVSMSGSLVIGLAVTRGVDAPDALWDLSRIDETWQEEQWGRDEEAHAQAEYKRGEFLHAARYYAMCLPQR